MPIGVTITVVHEAPIPRVNSKYASRVLDRAPILLGTRPDLANVCEYTVRIGAISAIELLEYVEVAELFAVECHVVHPTYAWDPIHRKAHRLVNGDKQIK